MIEQLAISKKLGLSNVGLPISSDTIESLFGVAKHHGVGAVKDPNRIALHIPALCGKLTPQDAQRTMDISTSELKVIVDGLTSLTKQRREILPNPGTLEQLADKDVFANVELLPGSKTREKVAGNPHGSCSNAKRTGPKISSDIPTLKVKRTALSSLSSTA